MLGLSYFHQQKYQSSISYLRRYVVGDPNNIQASLAYATSLLATNNSNRSLQVLVDLNERFSDNDRVLSLLSDTY